MHNASIFSTFEKAFPIFFDSCKVVASVLIGSSVPRVKKMSTRNIVWVPEKLILETFINVR